MLLKKIQINGEWYRVVGMVSGEENTKYYRSGWALYICRRGHKTVLVPMDVGMQPFDKGFFMQSVKLGKHQLDAAMLKQIEELKKK